VYGLTLTETLNLTSSAGLTTISPGQINLSLVDELGLTSSAVLSIGEILSFSASSQITLGDSASLTLVTQVFTATSNIALTDAVEISIQRKPVTVTKKPTPAWWIIIIIIILILLAKYRQY